MCAYNLYDKTIEMSLRELEFHIKNQSKVISDKNRIFEICFGKYSELGSSFS